jgi:hypothetical protein
MPTDHTNNFNRLGKHSLDPAGRVVERSIGPASTKGSWPAGSGNVRVMRLPTLRSGDDEIDPPAAALDIWRAANLLSSAEMAADREDG